jgi:hypothetical protein
MIKVASTAVKYHDNSLLPLNSADEPSSQHRVTALSTATAFVSKKNLETL